MKTFTLRILVIFFIALSASSAQAQCDWDQLYRGAARYLPKGFYYKKSYRIDQKAQTVNGTKWEYTNNPAFANRQKDKPVLISKMILSRDWTYVMTIANKIASHEHIIITLYDKNHKLVKTKKYIKDDLDLGIILECENTGLYYLVLEYHNTSSNCLFIAVGERK